ncbi:unnamed protein product [Chrysodeixis includens]|uniref:C-type lectin domain-containing protein n=1 Tax=Chrysodeixis includens TaxID=689277 RepID=A0A9N8KZX1_CHRIL|nr:unnamed protein product [Chrysodeixis includens]
MCTECFCEPFIDGQRDKKFFRKDYTYLEASESFYKVHTLHKTWAEAKKACRAEGTTLFYPENEQEANAVVSFWNSTQPFQFIYIGISDLVAKGVFETVDGLPISDVYNKWGPGEPNDAGGIEDCVVLTKDTGHLNDDSCHKRAPFICKKTLVSLEWNQQCDMPNPSYIFNQQLGRCYRLHTKPLNWTDAHAACHAEQGYLAVINSQEEADYLVQLTQTPVKKVSGNFMRGAVHLGFHNRGDEGWQTVRGSSLEDSGYSCWGSNQPDGDEKEQCGSMFYNGHLNDISCSTRCFYICEHEVDTLSNSFDDRFGSLTVVN